MNKLIYNFLSISLLFALIFSFSSCGSDDAEDNTAELIQQEEEKYNTIITPEIEKVLIEKLGASIHRGINPPDVTGYYRMQCTCRKSTIAGDLYVGRYVCDYALNLYDQKGLDINFLGHEISSLDVYGATHVANGSFISGEGDKFSIFFDETVISANSTYVQTILSIWSGELDRNDKGQVVGIKNMQFIYYMKDNDGQSGVMPNNSARLYEDSYVPVMTKEKFDEIDAKSKKVVNDGVSFSLFDLK